MAVYVQCPQGFLSKMAVRQLVRRIRLFKLVLACVGPCWLVVIHWRFLAAQAERAMKPSAKQKKAMRISSVTFIKAPAPPPRLRLNFQKCQFSLEKTGAYAS